MTLLALFSLFPTVDSVIEYFLKIRYPNGVVCPHCGSVKVYHESGRHKVFVCKDCVNTFSPFTNTIFEKSSTDLRKWVLAISLFTNAKKGISAKQLQRDTGVTYKTAWRMLQQIRLAMGNSENQQFFNTIVEIDETYVGGKPRKKNHHNANEDKIKGFRPKAKYGRGTEKTAVVGIIDRNNKKVYAQIALPNIQGQRLTATQLIDILSTVSKKDNKNIVMTDEFTSYNPLERNGFVHLRVNHKEAYSNGNGVHTNNIESFWATLKRGVYGVYHHISVKYMQKYVDEFCFRYNNRAVNMFDLVLKQSIITA
jgi:transposase-like protein